MGMDVFGVKPVTKEGEYFRANIWSWRPIHALCETVLNRELPWSHNDGEGFAKQSECDELAKALEDYLAANPNESISIESTMRVDASGRLSQGTTEGESAYSTDQDHVRQFITFLRACGGFQIC